MTTNNGVLQDEVASTGFHSQEGPFFCKILKINVVIVIMHCIDG
jgi:hypothetical protein